MVSAWRVLVVSQHPATWGKFCRILEPWPLEVVCCSTAREARDLLGRQLPAVVFCEHSLADGSYRDLVEAAKLAKSKVRIIVMLSMDDSFDLDPYLEAMRQGAWDVLRSSFGDTDVEWMVVHALHDEARALSADARAC